MKKIKCNVCESEFEPKSIGVCVDNPIIGSETYWDYMDCPFCGCQLLLKKRLPNFGDDGEQNDEID